MVPWKREREVIKYPAAGNGIFDPRGSRQISMQAWLLGSLFAGIKQGGGRMGSVIVGLVLAGIVGLAVRSMVKDKKNGKSIQCGGECKNCGGHCH